VFMRGFLGDGCVWWWCFDGVIVVDAWLMVELE